MLSRLAGGTLIAFSGLLLEVRPVPAQTRPAIDLVTHSRVTIDRPAAAIWPSILDPSAWKRGARLTHRSGGVNQVGEVLAAAEPNAPDKTAFLVENVEVVPAQRRTIKLYLPSGTLIGYASWILVERGGKTEVSYDVYSETPLGPDGGGMTEADRVKTEREQYQANLTRFDAELVALKKLIEGR